MNVAGIKADAFCASIEKALKDPPDIVGSIRRIQNTLNALPEGSLYALERGSQVLFYKYLGGKQQYLSKKSDELYPLARKKYQMHLLDILKLSGSTRKKDIEKRKEEIQKLQRFIRKCGKSNLDIERIVLTGKQYGWFTKRFKQKPINENTPFRSKGGVPIRSKSERDILNGCEDFALPIHYEEQMFIYVEPLVDALRERLMQHDLCKGQICTRVGGVTQWFVPSELEWMNTSGSLWKTYYPPKGTVTIYNDFKGMFADGSIFIWEHAGLIVFFTYRCNSNERAAIMKITGQVEKNHYFETFEEEVDTPEKISVFIERNILPRIWF